MGSGTGARWVIILAIYFIVFSFFASLVNNLYQEPEQVTTPGGITTERCGGPRVIYEQYVKGAIGDSNYEETIRLSETSVGGSTFISERDAKGHIACGLSQGTQSNSTCEAIPGCSWEDPSAWWQSGEETCIGTINLEGVEEETGFFGGGALPIIQEHNNTDNRFVCTHPEVVDNRTRCEMLSCDWRERKSIDSIDIEGVDPESGRVRQMYDVIAKLFTFKYDFGIDDQSTNIILNAVFFWIPLLGGVAGVIVMARG